MPRPHIAMQKIREVLRLRLGEGLSLRQVSLATGVPFTTAGDYVRRAEAAGVTWPLPADLGDEQLQALVGPSKSQARVDRPMPDYKVVHREMMRKGVTLALLWTEYRESFPDGYGYTQFCDHYRQWKRHLNAVMRQDHKAGEKLFIDFPGDKIPIYDTKTMQVAFHAELFVAVLGASSYLHAEVIVSQELEHWLAAHVSALEHLEGAPAVFVPDNLKSGVTKSHRYEPDVNASYEDMAAHYGVAVIPARAYKPRDKSKVEAGVLLCERWIMAKLRNCRFTSIEEANLAVAGLVDWLNDRPFKKLEGTRRSLFETIDRPALRPLPAERYEFARFRDAKVAFDYHVQGEDPRHYYSVPHTLIGEVVRIRTTALVVEILYKGRRVASHVRDRAPNKYTTDPSHMPESHKRYAEWSPARIVSWAEKTGPATAELVSEIMERRPHPEQGFRSCLGIIRLGQRHGEERLEAACKRALHVHSYSYRSVESILKNKLDEKPLPGTTEQLSHPTHDNVRGAGYYE